MTYSIALYISTCFARGIIRSQSCTARPDTRKRDERRAETNPTEPQAKPEAPPPLPVLREAVLLAEDAHSPKPQLVPGPHDPHSNLASVRGHEALEWHVEGSPVSCCGRLLLGDRRGVQCSAPPSGTGQRCRGPAKHHAADGRQQHSRSDLHDASEGSRKVFYATSGEESRACARTAHWQQKRVEPMKHTARRQKKVDVHSTRT